MTSHTTNDAANGTPKHTSLFATRADALAVDDLEHLGWSDTDEQGRALYDGDQLERDERAALRRVAGLSTELEDVTEVEYRQLRLERVVLAGVWTEGTAQDAENSMRELAALAETAGSTVLDGVIQRRHKPDPATYLGKGKAIELRDIVVEEGADTVICDSELAPSQRRALEDVVKVKVIDRTALILDIFAQHAKSREGKAQVELAQLQYLLPRLRGWGDSMSRQAGGQAAGGQGMGSRGPGETKIELDRRRINTRMAKLKREIKDMKTNRDTKRSSRTSTACRASPSPATPTPASPRCSTASRAPGVLVENQLFATLDPTVRRAETDDGRLYTLADTVGFVRALPTELIEAFRSTLEEVAGRRPAAARRRRVAPRPGGPDHGRPSGPGRGGGDQIKEVIVVNKADLADPEVLDRLRRHEKHCIIVSARTGEGLGALRGADRHGAAQARHRGRCPRPLRARRPHLPDPRGRRGARQRARRGGDPVAGQGDPDDRGRPGRLRRRRLTSPR